MLAYMMAAFCIMPCPSPGVTVYRNASLHYKITFRNTSRITIGCAMFISSIINNIDVVSIHGDNAICFLELIGKTKQVFLVDCHITAKELKGWSGICISDVVEMQNVRIDGIPKSVQFDCSKIVLRNCIINADSLSLFNSSERLKSIMLSNTVLTNTKQAELFDNTSVNSISIEGNSLNEDGFMLLSRTFSGLIRFRLHGADNTGKLNFKSLASMKKLKYLTLDECGSISDEAIANILDSKSIEYIDVHDTRISKHSVAKIEIAGILLTK